MSFLRDDSAITETIKLLKDSGCTKQGADIFEHVVREYSQHPSNTDLSKFPKATNGFYWFASPHDLVAALPERLDETSRPFDFNCSDTVLAIAAGRLDTASKPDDIIGPLMVMTWITNRAGIIFAATPRDAFNADCPSAYQNTTDHLFPGSLRDYRICLHSELLEWYPLPQSTSSNNVAANTQAILRKAWHRDRLTFPKHFEVVLLHSADISSHTLCTFHTALLFHSRDRYVYIEKAGTSGPFIRLDCAKRSDLPQWLAFAFRYYPYASSHHFATFNDGTVIEVKEP